MRYNNEHQHLGKAIFKRPGMSIFEEFSFCMLLCSYSTLTCVSHKSRTLLSDLIRIFARKPFWFDSERKQTILVEVPYNNAGTHH